MSDRSTISTSGKPAKHWRRWLLYPLLVIVLLAALALGVTQTPWFRNYLRDRIVESANASLNGKLTIDHISGSLFSSVVLHNIAVTQVNDTLVSIPRLAIAYDLWPLLHDEILVTHLLIDQPRVHLAMREDSTWNIASLTNSVPAGDTLAAAAGSSPDWTIRIGAFDIHNGSIRIDDADSLVPAHVESLSVNAGAVYSSNDQRVDIREIRFVASDPVVRLERLSGTIQLADSTVSIDTMIVATERNRVAASGRYEFRKVPSGHLTLTAHDIDLRELASFFSYEMPDARPSLTLDADLFRDSLQTTIALRAEEQFVTISGWANPLLAGLADTTGARPAYACDVDLNILHLQPWIADTLASGAVSGTAQISGIGLSPDSAIVNADLRLSRGSVMGYAFDSAHLVATYHSDSADVRLKARGRFGDISLDGSLADIRGTLRYDIRADTRGLDVQPFGDSSLPSTALTMSIRASGNGYEMGMARGTANIAIAHSRVGTTELDTLAANLHFDPDYVTVDTFYITGSPGSLTGGGSIGLDERGSFRLRGEIGNIDWLAHWLEIDTLRASGHIDAQLDGTLDSLSASGVLSLSDLVYDTYAADSVSCGFSLAYVDSTATGDYDLTITNLLVSDRLIPTTTLSGQIAPTRYTATLNTRLNDQIAASLHAEYVADSIPIVSVNDVDLQLGEQHWTSGTDTTRLLLPPDRYELQNLRLSSPDVSGRTVQPYVAIDGTYDLDSTHEFTISARGIALSQMMGLVDPTRQIGGELSLDVTSSGRIDNPHVSGTVSVRDGAVNDYQFDSLAGNFSLIDSIAGADFTLHVQGPESLVVVSRIPLAMLTDTTGTAPDSGLSLSVESYGFTLAILQAFGYTVENAEGDLDIELHAGRSVVNPRLDGRLRIRNGRVQAPEYGIDYRNIGALITFDSSSATLSEFVAHRDKGTLRMTGGAQFAGGLVSGRLDAADLTVNAKDFYIVRHRHYDVQISADANLDGPVSSPQYGGTVTVRRSNVYLPALSDDISEGSSMSVPMLVAALADTAVIVDTTMTLTVIASDTTAGWKDKYLENLRGRLTVRFPRNTWLRDDDMNIEIEGQIDVVKEGAEFELFGTIDVVRGDYSLYGKQFRIDEGRLSFDGGETVNPRLAIHAVYVFRTPTRDKRSLTLAIGGRAEAPTLSFSLDGSSIEEGDAVSYILFGRNLSELTSGQRSAISADGSSKTDAAKGAIANLLAGQLSRTLGDEFSLDVIEINAQSDWQSASFVVGKYITTDLFVSYQRGLGTTREDDEVVPEIVTLEYELSRHLFFQLVAADARKSGFDVIVKFEAR